MPPHIVVVPACEAMSDGYLSLAGRLHAARLVARLGRETAGYRVVRVYVAPALSCVQTLLPFCWAHSVQPCVEHALVGGAARAAPDVTPDQLRLVATAAAYVSFEAAALLGAADARRLDDFVAWVRAGFAADVAVVLCPLRAGEVLSLVAGGGGVGHEPRRERDERGAEVVELAHGEHAGVGEWRPVAQAGVDDALVEPQEHGRRAVDVGQRVHRGARGGEGHQHPPDGADGARGGGEEL